MYIMHPAFSLKHCRHVFHLASYILFPYYTLITRSSLLTFISIPLYEYTTLCFSISLLTGTQVVFLYDKQAARNILSTRSGVSPWVWPWRITAADMVSPPLKPLVTPGSNPGLSLGQLSHLPNRSPYLLSGPLWLLTTWWPKKPSGTQTSPPRPVGQMQTPPTRRTHKALEDLPALPH